MRSRLLLFILVFGFLYSSGQITITLRKSFIDSFKNRLTVPANYQVYFAHKKANAAAADGDLHFAGFDEMIGLPMVAEIMNAKDFSEAVQKVHEVEGHGTPDKQVQLTGVWRLWCEHPGDIQDFDQGPFTIPIENTNPPHVFEIHPVTMIDGMDLTASLHKIKGYKYKVADDAFSRYANLRCHLTQTDGSITIQTSGIGYNYVDFWLQFNEPIVAREEDDGLFAFCTIYNSDFKPEEEDQDHLITHKLRVGFVKGSALYDQAVAAKKGDFLHVVGIPRINLNLISWRAGKGAERPEVLDWNLPYEMVAVGEL